MGQKDDAQKNEKITPVFLNFGPNALLPLPAVKTKQRNNKIFGALVLSLIFHGLLLYLWSPELEKLGTVSTKEPLKAEVKFKPVVNTPEQPDKNKPKKANYLAEVDQSTDHEQKAQLQQKTQAAKARKADKFLARSRSADPLGLHELPKNHENSASALIGEHLPEVKSGKNTQLNTWSWRHAPFFNRIKTQIGQVWAPNRQIARYDPQGTLLGQKDRVTVLSVTIDNQGRLKTLQVANSSGVAYLDEEAERAFKKAAPFPYPPKELFNTEDGFTFQFAFHLQQNKGLKFDFDWHQGD